MTAERIFLEDTFMWKGRNVAAEEPFIARLKRAQDWFDNSLLQDSRLIQGLEFEMAAWKPLDAVAPTSSWDLMPNEAGRWRLTWHCSLPPPLHPQQPQQPPQQPQQPQQPKQPPKLIALARREPGPDQWQLFSSDGIALGRALIRTLAISSALRSAKDPQRVEVAWNATFQKWEIERNSSLPVSLNEVFKTERGF